MQDKERLAQCTATEKTLQVKLNEIKAASDAVAAGKWVGMRSCFLTPLENARLSEQLAALSRQKSESAEQVQLRECESSL